MNAGDPIRSGKTIHPRFSKHQEASMSWPFIVRTMLVVILAVAAPAWSQTAQVRPVPDLSGVWVLERAEGNLPDRAVAALGAGTEPPVRLAIVQSAGELSISRHVDGRQYVNVFPLDGAEARQDTPQGTMKSRARWEEATLVIEGTRPFPWVLGTRQVRFTQQHRLNAADGTMTVEVVLQTPRGPRNRTAIFRRTGQ
jgi:hypothetical protein